MIYEFHPEAEHECIEAAAYYEQHVTSLGERFGSEARRATGRLLECPELGFPLDADLRRLMSTRCPYWLIYGSTSAVLRDVAVAHAHRRPGYWRSRVARLQRDGGRRQKTVRLIPAVRQPRQSRVPGLWRCPGEALSATFPRRSRSKAWLDGPPSLGQGDSRERLFQV
jgi:hypothetical protein